MRTQLQKELNLNPINRANNFIPKNVKIKADKLLEEMLWKINNPPKKQPFLTVGNYEKETFKSNSLL